MTAQNDDTDWRRGITHDLHVEECDTDRQDNGALYEPMVSRKSTWLTSRFERGSGVAPSRRSTCSCRSVTSGAAVA